MKAIITLLFLSLAVESQAQKTPIFHNKQDTVNCLKSLIRDSKTVGMGIESVQYVRFLFLLRLMDDRDFLLLARDQSPTLRVYGYLGLNYKNHKKWKKLRRAATRDSATVSMRIWDSVEECSVSTAIKVLAGWNDYHTEWITMLEGENERNRLFKEATEMY